MGKSGSKKEQKVETVKKRHLISHFDLEAGKVRQILDRAAELKEQWGGGHRAALLPGRVLTQVFEKPSLRTRVSFEAAMMHLGGSSIFLSAADAGLSGREPVADVSRVLGGYSDVIVLRTFSQKLVEDFGKHAGCCIVNGLTDEEHPCQALSDLLTIEEAFGQLADLKLVYVGDGNNVAMSLAIACGLMGMTFSIAAPKGYELGKGFLKQLKKIVPKMSLEQTNDPAVAVKGANVVYTDVWASMGQEAEKEKRAKVFADYQVNGRLMKKAPRDAKFLHCLPARRGLEVTEEVIDGPQSMVFAQAENRMHLAKGLFAWLLSE